jgi:hypothetical protein
LGFIEVVVVNSGGVNKIPAWVHLVVVKVGAFEVGRTLLSHPLSNLPVLGEKTPVAVVLSPRKLVLLKHHPTGG